MAENPDQPERPRAEPEIISPSRGRPDWPPSHGYTRTYGTQRIYVGRIGPFGFVLIMLIAGLLAAMLLLLLIGTALIWIPVVAVLVVVAAIFRLFGR